MSAAGRLWRRAPAWRVCLVGAIAATALAAMFPPGVPGWVRGLARPVVARVAGAPVVDVAAHYRPVAAAVRPGFSALSLPPTGHERSGAVAFAGRVLPLPAGRWETLALAHGDRPISGQVEVFARVVDGAMTGLLVVAGSDPVAHQPSPFDVTQTCDEPGTIARYVAPEPFGQGLLVHECWRLAALPGFDLAERGRADPVLDRALLRLRESDARIPERLVVLDYLRSDIGGFLTAMLFLPDTRRGGASGQVLEAWVRRYVAALHAGDEGVRDGRGVAADPG